MGGMRAWHWVIGSVALAAVAVGGAFWLTRGPSGVGVGEVPDREGGVIRIATLAMGGLAEQPGEDDRARLAAMARALELADADIVALQEVESLGAVEAFRDEYLGSLGYTSAASLDVRHHKGSENAVLSRFPIGDTKVWPTLVLEGEHPPTVHGEPNPQHGEAMRFRCSPIMVEVRVRGAGLPDVPIVLFNVDHKGGDKYRYWREAEAAAVSRLAAEAGASKRVVVLGSFHAERGSDTVDSYLDLGFTDVFRGFGDSSRVVTEASGDRTHLILVNEVLAGEVELDDSFVVGDAAEEDLAGLEHFPVVAALRIGG